MWYPLAPAPWNYIISGSLLSKDSGTSCSVGTSGRHPKEMSNPSDYPRKSRSGSFHSQRISRRFLHLLGWVRRARYSHRGFENQRYLGTWLLISGAIGVVAGLGAVAFYFSIEFCTHLFLGRIVGYLPPSPLGEGSPAVVPLARPWLLPLVTAFGGLLSGIIVSMANC